MLRASTSPDLLAASATCSASATFPVDALYGIQTLRAMENFCISGIELREPAQSRGDDGATSNSRNGPLSVTLYVLILKNP
jgi:hypothetical protein